MRKTLGNAGYCKKCFGQAREESHRHIIRSSPDYKREKEALK
ncbi:hypothetical protein LCGC14_1592200 [marine sediment metagenome]|uniref:Uncharacterized protein n=1 Tax=marine sediment metagenome TaxID=412755 RepID=A0A0F9LE58_9ZZZZ